MIYMNLRRQDENSVYVQAAFDSPANQKSRSNKKRQAIIDTWQQPVWPRLTKILFISMTSTNPQATALFSATTTPMK